MYLGLTERAGFLALSRSHLIVLVIIKPGDGPITRPVMDMKIKNSLKALKARHRDCKLIRRKGRVYIINKTAPRFKARQG